MRLHDVIVAAISGGVGAAAALTWRELRGGLRSRTWAHPFKWMAGWYEGWVDGPYLPTKNHPVYLRGYKRGFNAQDRHVERRSS